MSTSNPAAQGKPDIRRLILLVLGVWLLSIPMAEAVFRLLGERTTTDLAGLYQAFGNGGYRLHENVSATADTLQGRYSVSTNELGLRCPAGRDRKAEQSNPDILVLGDSQAFGAGLDFEQTVVGQLAAKAHGKGLHVENAAIGGHYLANQIELAQWLDSRGVHPRRILLFLSPYLIASAGEYNRVAVGNDGRLYDRSQKPGLTSWLKRNTVIYGRLRNAVNHFLPLSKDELTPMAVKIYLKRYQGRYREKTLQSLKMLSQWAEEHGASLAIAYTPLAVEFAFDPIRAAAKSSAGAVDPDVPFVAAQSAAAELGINFYDLRPALSQLSAERQVLTLPGDSHYNARTSAACAENVWKGLSGNGHSFSAASPGALKAVDRQAATRIGGPTWN